MVTLIASICASFSPAALFTHWNIYVMGIGAIAVTFTALLAVIRYLVRRKYGKLIAC